MTGALSFDWQRLKSLSLSVRFPRKHKEREGRKRSESDLQQMGLSLLVYTARAASLPQEMEVFARGKADLNALQGQGKGLGSEDIVAAIECAK